MQTSLNYEQVLRAINRINTMNQLRVVHINRELIKQTLMKPAKKSAPVTDWKAKLAKKLPDVQSLDDVNTTGHYA